MKKEIRYYTTHDGKQFAVIRFIGEKTGIVAECDTAKFPYIYYYPHLQLYDRKNNIERYENMADGCPCLTCRNFVGDNCAMIERGQCSEIDSWTRENERRRNPKQLKIVF